MSYHPTTNFKDSNNVDLGKKLVTKDYLLEVYGSILETLAPGLTVTPELWVWGVNTSLQLGLNDAANKSTPVTTFSGGINWESVSAGQSHSAAIKTDGTLWVWGTNSALQLGINNAANRSTPVTTFIGGTNWKQVSAGNQHTAAVKTDGTLWVWGTNSSLQLGINNAANRSTPVTTFAGGNNWKQVICNRFIGNTIATKTDGSLWVWGTNTSGNLGTNDINPKSTPVTTFLGGTNWKNIALGQDHALATKTDGSLWTWGDNAGVQLGTNDTLRRSTPSTTFAGGTNWKLVSAGQLFSAAIKTDGSLWVWGDNSDLGELGINNAANRSTPVTTFLGGNNWKSISCGKNNTTAIKTDGTLWVWGSNSSLQLGTNDTQNRSTPVTTFLGGNNWKSCNSGSDHVLTIKSIDYI